MAIQFRNFSLADLEHGLTVLHPEKGFPIWLPAIQVSLSFQHHGELIPDLRDGILSCIQGYERRFSACFRWRTRNNSGRLLKYPGGDDPASFVLTPALTGFSQHCSGGLNKIEAHPIRYVVTTYPLPETGFGMLHFSLPISWFLAHEAEFQEWLDEMCNALPLASGFAGLGGVGATDFPSRLNGVEYYILQHYFGLNPTHESRLEGNKCSWDGYTHSPQWIVMLGALALERLGGKENLVSQLVDANLPYRETRHGLTIQTGPMPDTGFHNLPASYVELNRILRPNRGDRYFISHQFNEIGKDDTSGTRWMCRFDPSDRGPTALAGWPGSILAHNSIAVGPEDRFGSFSILADQEQFQGQVLHRNI